MEKNYTEIDFWGTIEEAVIKLHDDIKHGKLTCINFNGHMLYSDTVTMDGAYLEITGMTKAEREKKHEEERQRLIQQEEEHKKQIPRLTEEWITKGHEILDDKYWEEWDRCVPIRLGDLYQGMELGCCLDIVKPLNDGCDFETAKQIIDNQGHSGMSYSLVKAMVKAFCDRGSEFVEFLA